MFSLPNLKSIFQNLNDLIFILDINGVFLEYHARDTEQLLVSEEFFISKHITEVMPPHISGKVLNAINLLSSGKSNHENFEYSLTVRNQTLWYDASITSFQDARNDETRILASIRNITKTMRDRILLERVLTTSLDGIMVAEAVRDEEHEIIDFNWLLANEAAARISGTDVSGYIGKRMLDVSPVAASHGLFKKYKTVVDSGNPWIDEKELPLDGESKWLHIEANSLNDGFVVRFRDMTAAKLEELKAKKNILTQKLFITQAPSAIAMLDNRLNYVACSARWLEDYGLVGQDIIGKNHYSLFPEISDSWKELHKQCLSGKIRKSERNLFVRADGIPQYLRWEGRPWYDDHGEIGGIIMYSEDISEKEKSKEKLSELNQELQLANEQKNRLFSVLAHDLRSPLSSIYSMLGILKDDSDSISRAELSSYILMAYETANNMQELLDDLLIWSKEQMGSSKFNAEKLEISHLVEGILKEQDQNLGKKDLQVTQNLSEVPVLFDMGSMKVIIRNFITNAIKFSKQGGEINISGSIENGFYKFTVKDEGIGMDSATYQRVVDNTNIESAWGTAGEKGSGIGLSISRSFIQKGNGEFILESEKDQGTLIGMKIPLN